MLSLPVRLLHRQNNAPETTPAAIWPLTYVLRMHTQRLFASQSVSNGLVDPFLGDPLTEARL